MTPTASQVDTTTPSLVQSAGRGYFPIAFVARLPFAMMVVGVLTLVVSARDSVGLAGLNSAAVGIGAALVGPLLGMAADRFGQRPVLLASGIANSLALLALSWVVFSPLPDAAVLGVALVVGATAPQVSPMSRSRLVAIITRTLPGERQPRALNGTMAYESAADETMFVFGPVIVGLLATTVHPAAPVIGAAVLTLAFVTAFAMHKTADVARDVEDGRVAQAPFVSVLAPRVLVVVAGVTGVGLFFGSMLTSLTAFMQAAGDAEAAGFVYGAMGVGSTILALSVAWFSPRFALSARWIVFALVMLAGTVLYATADSLVAVVIAIALTGVGIGPTLVTQYSLGADASPLGRSATVMTMLGSGIIVGQSASSAIVGAVAESHGVSASMWAPAVAAAIVVLAGVANALLARRA